MSEKIAKFVTNAILILLFLWVSGQLFFEKQIEEFFADEELASISSIDVLNVVTPYDLNTLDPVFLTTSVRERLINIYEPLAKADANLNMKPALALSWGLLDDKTWDFILRPNVFFHDGSRFDAKDVVATFDRVMNHESSELHNILASVDEIEAVGDNHLRITTHSPDPLLLQRLSLLFIIPSELEDEEDFVVGTGPYKFDKWEKGGTMTLKSFAGYWGSDPTFNEINITVNSGKIDRVANLVDGDANFLTLAPFDAIKGLESEGFEVAYAPSLELSFLLFNTESEVFNTANKRKAFSLAVDQDELIEILGRAAKPANQYVTSGVFGFNTDLKKHKHSLSQARKLAETTGLSDETIVFRTLEGLEVLGDYLEEKMDEIGVEMKTIYVPFDEFDEVAANEWNTDLYFIGYKSELGDSADFLSIIAASEGALNLGRYHNPKVDDLIATSLTSLDVELRQSVLKEIMEIIVVRDVIGIPLFEAEYAMAFIPEFSLEPRIDGFVYFDEINIK